MTTTLDANVNTAVQTSTFLDRVMARAQFPDMYDARDMVVVVYRTLRDLISTELAEAIAADLEQTQLSDARDKSLQGSIARLWWDTNPLVRTLSRWRAPLKVTGERFLRRVIEEGGGLPAGVTPEAAISAVFAETKPELSPDTERQLVAALPSSIELLWKQA
ncbi:MAG: DUF2267 domain-containing protein [Geitlerinemataceae cyanobacterium]